MSVWAGLIERLSDATGPDRTLDDDIAYALGWTRTDVFDQITGPEVVWHDGTKHLVSTPRFTKSLDAALTLVPDDHTIYLTRPNQTSTNAPLNLSYACVAPKGLGGPQFARKRAHLCAYSRTLPLALCIASIKARVSHGVDEPG